MSNLDNILKSSAFKTAMECLHKVKDYTIDDYREMVDSLTSMERHEGYEEEVLSLVNNMLLSYRMGKICFDELMLLMFRLSSSFVVVFPG